uniref:PPM-type phosphatase domain-containing protein n=1 Tax=Picea sitchensis TaxID=3332 RepID=A9NM48_PICSI|nr:unknown [Picea sitchensis]
MACVVAGNSPSVFGSGSSPFIGGKCPSPLLQRKRPQRLDVPFHSLELNAPCAAMEQPMEVNVEGLHYAVSSKKGRREFMEDTHQAMVNVLGDSKQAFFGVFDGHSGRTAAAFAAENIGQNIVDAMLGMEDETGDILEQAVRAGYLTTDAEFLKLEVGSGTCCVTALIINGNLVVSNAGDCRAVISRDGVSEALTCDHRAGREDERQRIENLSGIVDLHHGVWRVQGSLAVSRAIGDLHMKEWITAEPDTRKIEITSDCEFLILASDGLWDKVTNQEAVDIARPFCVQKQPNLTPFGGGPKAACKKLVEVAVTRKSQDDVSVMIVQLRHFCLKENKTVR